MTHPCSGCAWFHDAGAIRWCSVFVGSELPPKAWTKNGRCMARLEDRAGAREIVLAMRDNQPIPGRVVRNAILGGNPS